MRTVAALALVVAAVFSGVAGAYDVVVGKASAVDPALATAGGWEATFGYVHLVMLVLLLVAAGLLLRRTGTIYVIVVGVLSLAVEGTGLWLALRDVRLAAWPEAVVAGAAVLAVMAALRLRRARARSAPQVPPQAVA